MDFEAIYEMKPGPNSLLIHNVNQLNTELLASVIKSCGKSEAWHKFVVGNVESLSKEFILKTIIDFVHPLDFFPIFYIKKRQVFFLARNCLEAILKLIAHKLIIPNPVYPALPIRIAIVTNHIADNLINIDLSKNLKAILTKRYMPGKRLLNLSNFHSDPELKEFCLLSQPKLMLYVMDFARQFLSELNKPPLQISLSDNFITNLNAIDLLAEFKLTTIDLSNNELANIDVLEPLSVFDEVTNLKLDGNPLCNLYGNSEYIFKLKRICPKLVTIDGIQLFQANGFIKMKKNFLCERSGGDLVNQFIEYFYTIYDSENRTRLVDLYHKNAIFSVTASLIAMQKTFHTARLSHYLTISRNLRSPTRYFDRKDKFLYQGSENIMKLFSTLPRTVHDTLQFCCELIYYTPLQAILVVNGTFQEGSEKLGFTRTFVLHCDDDNAYSIMNDQLHVYNALNCQMRTFSRCFPNINHSRSPLPYHNRQYWELREAVRSITDLNYDYSQRFLDTYNYDLKSLLCNFVKLHLSNEIPLEAFIEHRKTPMLDPLCKTKLPLPEDVLVKTKSKYEFVTLSTAWMAIDEERLLAAMKITDPSSQILNVLHRPQTTPAKQPRIEEVIEVSDDDTEETPEQKLPNNKLPLPENSQAADNQIPSTSQGNVESSPSTLATPPADVFKVPRSRKRRRRGWTISNAIVGGTPLQPVAGAPAVNPSLEQFTKPQQLGMETNNAAPQVIQGKEINAPAPAPAGKKKNKKKGKKNPGMFNINVFKQEYFFNQQK